MAFQFRFGRPQKAAAAVLLCFFLLCCWQSGRAPLSTTDYRYALCGREMWEKPAPALGYFTTCGNMQGDGSLAYRAAALPLTVTLGTLRLVAHLRHAEDNPLTGSLYDLRHQLGSARYLMRIPFALAATLLGAGLWWVTRRLFGNMCGFFALLLYCLSPPVVFAATTPNNEILAAWGLYAALYTAIGIGHAMYGPRRRWRPRIIIFTLALGLAACAHVWALVLGLVLAAVLMLYTAQRERTAVMPIVIAGGLGALFCVFASYAFRLGTFLYVFTAGAARVVPTWLNFKEALRDPQTVPVVAGLVTAAFLWVSTRRSRYYGNTVPLLIALAVLPWATTEVSTRPALWAWPFLLTFVAGVFADALETRARRLYLALMGLTVLAQAASLLLALSGAPPVLGL